MLSRIKTSPSQEELPAACPVDVVLGHAAIGLVVETRTIVFSYFAVKLAYDPGVVEIQKVVGHREGAIIVPVIIVLLELLQNVYNDVSGCGEEDGV